ncbi:unnamed protein product [Microthlaspi erraticum]|uniref:SWIM-type domain-containing protein n=1 Tax=Microthlaspi erraticum TaxID=1685480 RepID=A0A6D2INF3_9BRAS|nr:unnamed protein product [Microthlaspi erraticum]
MVQIYVVCGSWKRCQINGWIFVADERKGGRVVGVESNTKFDDLKAMVLEDFSFESGIDVEFSYLPRGLINDAISPRVVISNDRQVQNFVGYIRKQESKQLCLTLKDPKENSGVHIDGNGDHGGVPPTDGLSHVKDEIKKGKMIIKEINDEEEVLSQKEIEYDYQFRGALMEAVKIKQEFRSKSLLKSTFEILAMKHNFDYIVLKSDTSFWTARCVVKECNWRVRAVSLKGTTMFVITKYVGEHTCAPSGKAKIVRTASAKTIGNLIMQKYEGVKEGPKPNDIIQLMRIEHRCKISYDLAWEAREFAVNYVRGIPEESYAKIPRYLHMLKEANPGTHTAFKTDPDGSFRYMFISFGQSIRGFYKAMRRVIVIDGTFLKNKYKGTLLVATALDGNSNLYPLAFGVVDSENDLSWEWFLRQLHVVIEDDYDLAFISDRNLSIGRLLPIVYQRATHGICIHHLLNNVISYLHGKGVAALVAKASKAYRIADFQTMMTDIVKNRPDVGKYLVKADVRKWARCLFVGYRYDVRTTNPAESLNSALRSPREFPVIPLLDSIREMLTRWFFKRRTLSSKHTHPLTVAVEKKITRRTEKGKAFTVQQVDATRFVVGGDIYECVVDLAKRTCTCAKFDLQKIPCRHAIPEIFAIGKQPHEFTDELWKTELWRVGYEEAVNPIGVPEDAWSVPQVVDEEIVSCPESRRAAGRRRKRRFESVEDKIRSQQRKTHKCSRCDNSGHNRATCDMPI